MVVNPKIKRRKLISMPLGLWERVEDYRFGHRIKTEAEAVRLLIEAGLHALTKTTKRR